MSVASHVCDEGYQPNATSSVRVCRDNGLWSGTTIVCGEWLINPRRACAARVTVLRLSVCLSVCLSVTTSLAYQAAKSLKFEHR